MPWRRAPALVESTRLSAPELFDISPMLSERTAVFPGDTPLSRRVALDFRSGHNLVLSAIEGTVHLGAHCDAPNHYHPNGESIETRSLRRYLGPCQVMTVHLPRGERILPKHLEGRSVDAPRVLFHTGSFPDPDHWNSDFNALSPELVNDLHDRGVQMVGIDTPSIDPADDKLLSAHQSVFQHDMAILEGIVLTGVPDGLYTLVALPLKIQGADASPVRAALVKGVL